MNAGDGEVAPWQTPTQVLAPHLPVRSPLALHRRCQLARRLRALLQSPLPAGINPQRQTL
jgi:hypothetical protein